VSADVPHMIFWVREERYLWRFERVVCREVDGEEEDSSGIRTIALKDKVSRGQLLKWLSRVIKTKRG